MRIAFVLLLGLAWKIAASFFEIANVISEDGGAIAQAIQKDRKDRRAMELHAQLGKIVDALAAAFKADHADPNTVDSTAEFLRDLALGKFSRLDADETTHDIMRRDRHISGVVTGVLAGLRAADSTLDGETSGASTPSVARQMIDAYKLLENVAIREELRALRLKLEQRK